MKKTGIIIGLLSLTLFAACTNKTANTISLTQYDIEIPFTDPVFVQIIEGEITPVEITHAEGGEGGYNGYTTTDPEIIQRYIEAFREYKLKEIYTDENDFNYICDGINDYIFTLDDGTQVLISLDLSKYTIQGDKQYEFEFNEKLSELNKLIQEENPE